MLNKIFLHIPHSSVLLTKEFRAKQKLLSQKQIKDFNFQMTDLYTDELFSFKCFSHLRANFSRICCDVEKFIDDKQEVMSKYGLGVIYTKNVDGKHVFHVNNEYKSQILEKYYYPYHKKLDIEMQKLVENYKNVVLVDCHSFSRKIVKTVNRNHFPDFCLGVNNDKKSQKLARFLMTKLYEQNFTVAINYPYSGSMIPDFLLNKKVSNFSSIMIEVNRKLYLKYRKKSNNFGKIRDVILNLLKEIENFDFGKI